MAVLHYENGIGMNGIGPFSLTPRDLINLGADRAVDFFRRLLWNEATRVGIARHVLDVPGCINEGDGGIDAYTRQVKPTEDEVIPDGTAGFQIKTSDLSPQECKEELH